MVAIVMTIVMVIRITMMASFIVISIAIMGIFLVRVHFGCCDCEFDLDISDNHSLLSFVWFYLVLFGGGRCAPKKTSSARSACAPTDISDSSVEFSSFHEREKG